MEKIEFLIPDSNEKQEFYVIEQTTINETNYILVTEEEDGDCDAFILKEIPGETEVNYEMVESEEELEALSKIFTSMLEDVDVIME